MSEVLSVSMPTSEDKGVQSNPEPPTYLSSTFVEEINRLSDEELRDVIGYEQALLNYRTAPPQRIETRPREELLRVTERDGYTEVVKRHPCPDSCSDCPHEPYLYHVWSERPLDGGDDTLHWSFLGRVQLENDVSTEG